jgi:hypothetical protein
MPEEIIREIPSPTRTSRTLPMPVKIQRVRTAADLALWACADSDLSSALALVASCASPARTLSPGGLSSLSIWMPKARNSSPVRPPRMAVGCSFSHAAQVCSRLGRIVSSISARSAADGESFSISSRSACVLS